MASRLTSSEVLDEVNGTGACAAPPTYGVTVNDVMGLPPSPASDHETVTSPLPDFAVTAVGDGGALAGADVLVVVAGAPTSDPPPEAPPPPPSLDPPTVNDDVGPSGGPTFPAFDGSGPFPVAPAPAADGPATVGDVACTARGTALVCGRALRAPAATAPVATTEAAPTRPRTETV